MNPRTLQGDDKSFVPMLYMAMELSSGDRLMATKTWYRERAHVDRGFPWLSATLAPENLQGSSGPRLHYVVRH